MSCGNGAFGSTHLELVEDIRFVLVVGRMSVFTCK